MRDKAIRARCILGTRASSEPILVLENCSVASVDKEILEAIVKL